MSWTDDPMAVSESLVGHTITGVELRECAAVGPVSIVLILDDARRITVIGHGDDCDDWLEITASS
jgi:hypothetical protein